jgi:hypothetical protein
LVSSVMSVMNLDLLSFNIFTLEYIEASVGLLDVTEVFTTVDKDLEPSRVGWPDLHVLGLTSGFDIPWLIVWPGSDSQGLLMEVPFLSYCSDISLNDHISSTHQVK